jgi:hypothetical protein
MTQLPAHCASEMSHALPLRMKEDTMGQHDQISCIGVIAMPVLARVFATKIELQPNGCILGANRKTRCKSSSETTKLTRICDRRGVTSPTR